jgi:hypothetical protein
MSKPRISYLNYADLAVITASPAAGALTPVTYLQSDARGDIFQATSNAPQEIRFTWGGTAYTISQFTLWRLNLAFGDTVRPIFYPNADLTGAPLYDPGASAAYAAGLFDTWGWSFVNSYFAQIAGVKSGKLIIASAASVRCARLFLGPFVEAACGVDYPVTQGQESLTKQTRSTGGSLRSDPGAQWRTLMFDMYVKTEADRAAWSEIGRYCDLSKSVVFSLCPGLGGTAERDFTYFGKFNPTPGQKLSAGNLYDFSVKLLEL